MTHSTIKKQPFYPYPLIRSGGLFLIIIGLSTIAAFVSGEKHFLSIGLTLAIFTLVFPKPLALAAPERFHTSVLFSSVIIGFVLLIFISFLLSQALDIKTQWLYIFLIFGIYLLPLSICFGPNFLSLGALTIIQTSIGLVLSIFSTEAYVIMLGGTKIGFGIVLLFFPPRKKIE